MKRGVGLHLCLIGSCAIVVSAARLLLRTWYSDEYRRVQATASRNAARELRQAWKRASFVSAAGGRFAEDFAQKVNCAKLALAPEQASALNSRLVELAKYLQNPAYDE